MAGFDLNKPADRERARVLAGGPAYRDHPSSKLLLAALDLLDVLGREALARARRDAAKREAGRMADAQDPWRKLGRIFGEGG
jgi:hypothetical protein